MAILDRAAARALTEAGYMPLDEYIALFGEPEAPAGLAPTLHRSRHRRLVRRGKLSAAKRAPAEVGNRRAKAPA